MAKNKDAIAALGALNRHADLVVASHLGNHGIIEETPQSQAAIKALKKHRLVWHHDEMEEARISGAVTQLLDNSLQNHRRHIAHEAVAELWDHLRDHLLDQYQDARKRLLNREVQRVKGEIYDCVFDLMEQMSQSINAFAQYLTSGFTYISDLHLRIRANERVLKKANRLNELLCSFSMEDLNIMAGRDRDLNKLLMRQLPMAIDRCQKELLNSLHHLSELLNNLRDYAEHSRLLGVFEAAYGSDQSFSPSIDSLTKAPELLNNAESLLAKGFSDTTDVRFESAMANLCQGLRPGLALEEVIEENLVIEDSTEAAYVDIEIDEITSSATIMIDTVLQERVTLTATEAYQKMAVDCEPDLWVFALLGSFYALSSDQRRTIGLEFIERRDPIFRDNYIVSDLRLSPVYA